MFYTRLTADQVTATYGLFRFLERLRVIGHLKAHTEKYEPTDGEKFGEYVIYDFTGADYSIVKDSYTNDHSHMDTVLILERIFGKRKFQLRGTD